MLDRRNNINVIANSTPSVACKIICILMLDRHSNINAIIGNTFGVQDNIDQNRKCIIVLYHRSSVDAIINDTLGVQDNIDHNCIRTLVPNRRNNINVFLCSIAVIILMSTLTVRNMATGNIFKTRTVHIHI